MKQVLEYVGTLLHMVGILLLVGGHIWFGFFTAMTERRKDREGANLIFNQSQGLSLVVGAAFLLLAWAGRGAYARAQAADATVATGLPHFVSSITPSSKGSADPGAAPRG